MVADKVVVSPVDTVAVAKIDWHNPKQAQKFLRDIGDNMSAKQVWANIATAYFNIGKAAKTAKDNAPPDVAPYFNVYREAKAQRDGKAMKDKTAETYASVAKTLTEIGFTIPYDGATLVEYFATNGGGIAYGSRAKLFRNIADNFKHEPTKEEIAKFVALLTPDVTNLSDDIAPVQSSVERVLAAHTGLLLENDDLDELAIALTEAMNAFVEKAKLIQPPTPKAGRGKTLTAEQIALKAKRDARNAPTSH